MPTSFPTDCSYGLICSAERKVAALDSPVISLLEHVFAGWVERPIIPLSLSSALSRHFDEAFVERQIVADRVLPAFLVLLVKWEFVDDELVDLREGQTLLSALSVDGKGPWDRVFNLIILLKYCLSNK